MTVKKGLTPPSKTPEVVQIRDSFETPRYAVDLLLPFIPRNITNIWECAAGGGRIVQPLTDAGYSVYPSDILITDKFPLSNYYNFLSGDETGTIPFPIWEKFQAGNVAIITNPPFSVKREFIQKAFGYGVPFAMLINADYSGEQISWIQRGCEKIISNRRISYITPNMLSRINDGEGTSYSSLEDISGKVLKKYSTAQFHSMWLTYKFGLGKTETFVDLPLTSMENFF